MPNTAVGSLAAITVSSIWDAEFYIANSGASQKIAHKDLADLIPVDLSMDLILTSVYSVPENSDWNTIPFDTASRDPNGYFNAASAGLWTIDFTGAARMYGVIRCNSHGTDGADFRTYKNGAQFVGGFCWGKMNLSGDVQTMNETHVFTVASGDYFEVKAYGRTCSVLASSHIVFEPVYAW